MQAAAGDHFQRPLSAATPRDRSRQTGPTPPLPPRRHSSQPPASARPSSRSRPATAGLPAWEDRQCPSQPCRPCLPRVARPLTPVAVLCHCEVASTHHHKRAVWLALLTLEPGPTLCPSCRCGVYRSISGTATSVVLASERSSSLGAVLSPVSRLRQCEGLRRVDCVACGEVALVSHMQL